MNVVVTGAAGFIGSHVVDGLLDTGATVIGVDDLSRGQLSRLAAAQQRAGFSFHRADVTAPDFADLLAKTDGDVVCHLAAQIDVRVSVDNPVLDAERNVLGTLNVLEAARRDRPRRVVFASSGGAMYGDADVLPTPESVPLRPGSPYGAAKAAAEMYLSAYAESYGVPSVALALANVYGERQDPAGEAGVVAVFSAALLADRPTTIFGDGTATRDYVHVTDVAAAFVAACTSGSGRYNIGTGIETSVGDLHTRIATIVGGRDEPAFAPGRAGELATSALDASRARRELGWAPTVELAEGLRRTVEWIRRAATAPVP